MITYFYHGKLLESQSNLKPCCAMSLTEIQIQPLPSLWYDKVLNREETTGEKRTVWFVGKKNIKKNSTFRSDRIRHIKTWMRQNDPEIVWGSTGHVC